MEHIVLVIHLIVAVAMVIVVLLQRSEGAGLAGPSGGGMAPIRGSANILTRATAVLATIFFITSLTLAILAGGHKGTQSIADQLASQSEVPAVPAAVTPPTADVPTQSAPQAQTPATPTPPTNP